MDVCQMQNLKIAGVSALELKLLRGNLYEAQSAVEWGLFFGIDNIVDFFFEVYFFVKGRWAKPLA